MSSCAKDILIKSIMESVSTYAMGVFKFPTGLIGELERIVRDFWWGDEVNKRKMHWLSWDKVTRPKSYGGTGFRDLQMFNPALLGRQAWRLIHSPDNLCARLLKARYYPSAHLLYTAFIQNQSQTWQGIVHGFELLKDRIIWRIGTGSSVKFFRDNWLPRPGALELDGKKGHSRRKWVS
jgi:hypothetical protein